MARGKEKIDRVIPDLKRCAAILKDCSSLRIDMVATVSARICFAFFNAMECRFDTASRAKTFEAKALFHDMIETNVIIGETFEEITY